VDVRKILVLLLVGFAALGFAAFASGSTLLTGHANQHAVAQSGITGNISFIDNGTTLSVRGTATGLNPAHDYFSLLYDGPAAGGPKACLPVTNSQTDAQMIVGLWHVNSDGTGTISVDKKDDAYVPLNDVHTISIRDVNQDFLLQACGEIGVIQD
jgi:hypothetical protein